MRIMPSNKLIAISIKQRTFHLLPYRSAVRFGARMPLWPRDICIECLPFGMPKKLHGKFWGIWFTRKHIYKSKAKGYSIKLVMAFDAIQ
jgi:hypothetical protein